MSVHFISHCDVVLACVTAAYRAMEAGKWHSLLVTCLEYTSRLSQNRTLRLHARSPQNDNMTYAAIIKNKDKRSLRKIKKCEVEKRRRERIEISLEHMKALVLNAYGKNASDYEKMEKADIMEMTVTFLAKVTRAQQSRHVMLPTPYQTPSDANMHSVSQLRRDVNNNNSYVPRHLVQPLHQSPGLLMIAPEATLPRRTMTSPICASPSSSFMAPGSEVWRPW